MRESFGSYLENLVSRYLSEEELPKKKAAVKKSAKKTLETKVKKEVVQEDEVTQISEAPISERIQAEYEDMVGILATALENSPEPQSVKQKQAVTNRSVIF